MLKQLLFLIISMFISIQVIAEDGVSKLTAIPTPDNPVKRNKWYEWHGCKSVEDCCVVKTCKKRIKAANCAYSDNVRYEEMNYDARSPACSDIFDLQGISVGDLKKHLVCLDNICEFEKSMQERIDKYVYEPDMLEKERDRQVKELFEKLVRATPK